MLKAATLDLAMVGKMHSSSEREGERVKWVGSGGEGRGNVIIKHSQGNIETERKTPEGNTIV